MDEGVAEDLLTDTDGLAVWLAANALDFTADEATLRHALTARDALRAAVDGSLTEGAGRVDAVLAHGRIRATLTAEGPGEEAEFRTHPGGPPGSPRVTTWNC